MNATKENAAGPLQGIRVLDLATLFAGPLAATLMGDFGADVIKIEHPKGDPVRSHGHLKNGVNLWWKMIGRNKRAITLNLSRAEAQGILLDLAAQADVLIENFRPGTLESWNVGPTELHARNPRLVIARVTGFGQEGPYRRRPGFGTLAESMSGFAAMTGPADGPPTLPPFGLADGITALATASAVMMALRHRDLTGQGQIIDMAIIEPILTILGPQATWYDQLGVVQERTGNRSVNNAPRNTYRTLDGKWVAISTSAQSIAERVMRLVGHPEVIDEPWFRSGADRARHADTLDEMVGGWIARHPMSEVMREFEAAEAAVAPIYDIRDVLEDPQYKALDSITTVNDEDLGPVRMQNVMFRLSATPGSIRFAGRKVGADTEAVLSEWLGIDSDRVAELRAKGAL
ncbi:MAG: CoA transferase [Vicinamibacteria bacterium]|nr:CoA transferase [Vicinamibacteria bacterium]